MILAAGGGSSSDADSPKKVNVVADDTEVVSDDESSDCLDLSSVCTSDAETNATVSAASPPPPRKPIAQVSHVSIASSVGSEIDPSRPVPPSGLSIPSSTRQDIGYDRNEHRQRVKIRKALKRPAAVVSRKPARDMVKRGGLRRFQVWGKQKVGGGSLPEVGEESLLVQDVKLVESV